MIRLLALDMDGTLLNEQKQLLEPERLAIHQAIEAGVTIVLCTGRMLPGVIPYAKQLGLDKTTASVIVNNGCSTHQTTDWALVDAAFLSPEDVPFLQALSEGTDMQLTLFDQEHYYVVADTPNKAVQADAEVVFLEPICLTLDATCQKQRQFFQAMFVGEKAAADAFEFAHAQALQEQFDIVRSQPTILEILPKGVNKASALQKLAQSLGITQEEVMAIGDANNDLEMLAWAGLGVAMGNASSAVKAIAKDVTLSNQDNGVAHAIHTHILQPKENK